MADEQDPAAHWAMGRALWLRGRVDESLTELDTSVELSPNFALGHYTLAFIHAQSGDPQAAIRFADHSRVLSPFDPLLFAMLATRAMALIRLGRFDEAADWAAKARAAAQCPRARARPSPRTAWPWPGASTRRARSPARSCARCPATASTTS